MDIWYTSLTGLHIDCWWCPPRISHLQAACREEGPWLAMRHQCDRGLLECWGKLSLVRRCNISCRLMEGECNMIGVITWSLWTIQSPSLTLKGILDIMESKIYSAVENATKQTSFPPAPGGINRRSNIICFDIPARNTISCCMCAIPRKELPGNADVLAAVPATAPLLVGPHSSTDAPLFSLLPYQLPCPAPSHQFPVAASETEPSPTHTPPPPTVDAAQSILDLEAGLASLFVIMLDWTLPNLWADLLQIPSTCSLIRVSRCRRSEEHHCKGTPVRSTPLSLTLLDTHEVLWTSFEVFWSLWSI